MSKWLNDVIIKWANRDIKEELTQYKYIDKQLTCTMDVLNNTQNPNNTSIENLKIILENNKNDISDFENNCVAKIKTYDILCTIIISFYLPFCFSVFSLKSSQYSYFQIEIFFVLISAIGFYSYIKAVFCKHILKKRLAEIKCKFNKAENRFSEILHAYENEVLRFTIIRDMRLIKEEIVKEINKHEQK